MCNQAGCTNFNKFAIHDPGQRVKVKIRDLKSASHLKWLLAFTEPFTGPVTNEHDIIVIPW